MKPFDLEKALAGEPVVTRKGYKVTHVTHYLEADQDDFCISALIHDDQKTVETFKINGSYNYSKQENPSDLFMGEHSIWVNIYYSKTKSSCWGSAFYSSKEEAIANKMEQHYQTTIKLKP